MKTFYVYNPETGYTRHQHRYESDARREAERLAREHVGKEFEVLERKGTVKVEPPPVVWTGDGQSYSESPEDGPF